MDRQGSAAYGKNINAADTDYLDADSLAAGLEAIAVGYTRWMLYLFAFMTTFSELWPSMTN